MSKTIIRSYCKNIWQYIVKCSVKFFDTYNFVLHNYWMSVKVLMKFFGRKMDQVLLLKPIYLFYQVQQRKMIENNRDFLIEWIKSVLIKLLGPFFYHKIDQNLCTHLILFTEKYSLFKTET